MSRSSISDDAAVDQLPYLLYLPDIDGVGLSSSGQWTKWSQHFDLTTLLQDTQCSCSFPELSAAVTSMLRDRLHGVPPERPVYLLGEGAGAVLALHVAYQCRQVPSAAAAGPDARRACVIELHFNHVAGNCVA